MDKAPPASHALRSCRLFTFYPHVTSSRLQKCRRRGWCYVGSGGGGGGVTLAAGYTVTVVTEDTTVYESVSNWFKCQKFVVASIQTTNYSMILLRLDFADYMLTDPAGALLYLDTLLSIWTAE